MAKRKMSDPADNPYDAWHYTKRAGKSEDELKAEAAPKRRMVNWTTADNNSEGLRLRHMVTNTQRESIDEFVARSDKWFKYNERINGADCSSMNQFYQRQMLMMCVMPLTEGISARSITAVMGAYVGICAVDPSFKQKSMRIASQLSGNISEQLGKRNEPGSMFRFMDNPKVPGIVRGLAAPFGALEKPLARLSDSTAIKANGGRVPYTKESAANMYIGMCVGAYKQMQTPVRKGEDFGIRNAKVEGSLLDGLDTLKKLYTADGINEDDVNREVQVQLGQMADVDPKILNCFSQTATGNVLRDTAHEETVSRIGSDGKAYAATAQVWDGDWVTRDEETGLTAKYTEPFTVRRPDRDTLSMSNAGLRGMQSVRGSLETMLETKGRDALTPADMGDVINVMRWSVGQAMEDHDLSVASTDDDAVSPQTKRNAQRLYESDDRTNVERQLARVNDPVFIDPQSKAMDLNALREAVNQHNRIFSADNADVNAEDVPWADNSFDRKVMSSWPGMQLHDEEGSVRNVFRNGTVPTVLFEDSPKGEVLRLMAERTINDTTVSMEDYTARNGLHGLVDDGRNAPAMVGDGPKRKADIYGMMNDVMMESFRDATLRFVQDHPDWADKWQDEPVSKEREHRMDSAATAMAMNVDGYGPDQF